MRNVSALNRTSSFGARYYASNLGRFMSADPLGGDIYNPQSLNRFAYAWNNPVTFTFSQPLNFNETRILARRDAEMAADKTGPQDKRLTQGEIDRLKAAGYDPERMKSEVGGGARQTSTNILRGTFMRSRRVRPSRENQPA